MTTLIISYYVRFIIDKEIIEHLVSMPSDEKELSETEDI